MQPGNQTPLHKLLLNPLCQHPERNLTAQKSYSLSFHNKALHVFDDFPKVCDRQLVHKSLPSKEDNKESIDFLCHLFRRMRLQDEGENATDMEVDTSIPVTEVVVMDWEESVPSSATSHNTRGPRLGNAIFKRRYCNPDIECKKFLKTEVLNQQMVHLVGSSVAFPCVSEVVQHVMGRFTRMSAEMTDIENPMSAPNTPDTMLSDKMVETSRELMNIVAAK